jgi:uncharacterized protein DUF2330
MRYASIALYTVAMLAGSSVLSARAHACGGLFCNLAQPVNQAAERILFVDNGDGTVTAVIEIQYEGPSNKFSWILPVPKIPTVGVSSTSAFDRLQQATDPQFTLQRTFADCGGSGGGLVGSAPVRKASSSGTNDAGAHEVQVLAMGTVGPFDYEVIKVDPSLSDRAEVAVKWLGDNGYDVGELGPDVLRPYLESDLNLLAFRLNKDSMTGSIRPVVVKYEADRAFIPIRPTAVAADDDMGVMVFVAGKSRAIPSNYKALEINEARIDWFNPMSTYNAVVSAAADEAGGQGFVTEYAQPNPPKGVVLRDYERSSWQMLSTTSYPSGVALLNTAKNVLGGLDGFLDAVRMAAKNLPSSVTVQDLVNCPTCYAMQVQLDPTELVSALYTQVYKPLSDTEDLLTSRSYLTRFYTTMSADEMTTDPSFDFNPDLPNVSNQHMAMQKIECDQSWTIELPQGDVVAGKAAGSWPGATKSEPAARTIAQLGTAGKPKLVVDNSAKITKTLIADAKRLGVVVQAGADGGPAKVMRTNQGCNASEARAASAGTLSCMLGALLVLIARRRSIH